MPDATPISFTSASPLSRMLAAMRVKPPLPERLIWMHRDEGAFRESNCSSMVVGCLPQASRPEVFRRSAGRGVVTGIAALTVTVAVATVSGALHIRLVNEGSPGPLYECDAAQCTPARIDDPSRKNLSWMDFYVLPDGCVALAGARLQPGGAGIDVECGLPGHTTRYRCQAGSCRALGEGEPETGRPIPLPADCGGRIHELIVLNAGSDALTAFIECDASSGAAGGM